MTTTELRPPLVETAHVLADALSAASLRHAMDMARYHRGPDGTALASLQPLDLMPDLVEALIARPDLLRELLAQATADGPRVGQSVLGSEAAGLPIGSSVEVERDPGYGDLSTLHLRRVHHVSGWSTPLLPDGVYRVLEIGPS